MVPLSIKRDISNDTADSLAYCYCSMPRGNGKSTKSFMDMINKYNIPPGEEPYHCIPAYRYIKIPTDDEIRSKVVVYRQDNYEFCCANLRYRYNDGRVSCEYLNRLNDGEDEPESIKNQILDYIVEQVKNKYKELLIKEATGMNMNDYNEFTKNLRVIGGCLEVEWGSLYERPMSKISVPTEYLDRVKIELTSTDSCKKIHKCHRYIPGLDIPGVVAVDTYNDRVVKVTFSDGSFTKSVCGKNDTFDLDVGITICIMKKAMGKDGHKLYNNLIRDVHATMEKNERDKERERELKAEFKRRQRKAELKKAAKKAKARQEKIDIQKTAIIEANRVIGAGTGDDLK